MLNVSILDIILLVSEFYYSIELGPSQSRSASISTNLSYFFPVDKLTSPEFAIIYGLLMLSANSF